MFNFFKPKPVLTDENLFFQIETYKWLMKNFGGDAFYKETSLILPTREFFPTQISSPKEAALETFLQIKKYSGMSEWPCELIEQEPDIEIQVASTVAIQNVPATPHGTFSSDNESVKISYNPNLTNNPSQLVATLSHELAHYLTATAAEPPPGGWDNWEFATDLAAVFLGFGIFLANSAFSFQQYIDFESQGWSYQRSGYLSEKELIFALAIFCKLKGIENNAPAKYLKPNLKKILTNSYRQLEGSTELIDEIKAIKFLDSDIGSQ